MSRRIKIIFGLIIAATVFYSSYIFLINWRLYESPKEETSDRVFQIDKYQIHEKIYKYSGTFPDSSFDSRYQRVYTITENGWLPMEVARFEYTDRRNIGIKIADPKMVGEWLVIFSDRQTFLWKPQHQLIKFTPDRPILPNLVESPKQPIKVTHDRTTFPQPAQSLLDAYPTTSTNIYSDHLDHYQAIDFSIQGDIWLFKYYCDRDCQDRLNNLIPPKLVCPNQNTKSSIDDCKLVPNIYPNNHKVILSSKDRGKTFQIIKN